MQLWFKTLLALIGALWLGQSSAVFADQATAIAVAVEDTVDAVRLRITPPTSDKIRLYVLGEPNRVVIDITGPFVAPRKDLVPLENPLVTMVRFGTHPDKIRVVADVKTREIPTPSLVATDDGVAILLRVEPDVRAAFLGTTHRDAGPNETATESVETGDAPVGGQRLTELTFDRHPGDGSPVVRLGLTERPAFSFQKADAKTYRLTLPNCTVGRAQLAFPQYPPDDFSGFTIVEIRQAGTSTEVLVGVEPEFKIAPSTTENAILIRSMPRG